MCHDDESQKSQMELFIDKLIIHISSVKKKDYSYSRMVYFVRFSFMYLQSKLDSFYFLMKHMVRIIKEKCTNVNYDDYDNGNGC